MHPVPYHLNINDRQFNFQLDYDPKFVADNTIYTMFSQGNIPEKEVLSIMFNVLKPGDVAYDVGANIGYLSIVMAQLVGPTGKVLAFEPSRVNYEKLLDNVRLNKANINTYPLALWDSREWIDFYESDDTGSSALQPWVNGVAPSYKVTTTCLDIYSDNPKLIKIDCEGAEKAILRGGHDMLRKGVPFVICELSDDNLKRFGSDQFDVRNFMSALGYDCWLPRPDGLLPTYIPYGTAFRTNVLNLNVLFASEQTVTETWKYVDIAAG